jgi:nicotinamide mononucleotide (NMN) deamidase PncC
VYVIGDTVYEPNESFTVEITSWAGFNLARGAGTVTIVNDDPAPLTVSVGSASVTEGDRNTTNVNVPVTISRPLTGSETVVVTLTTQAGTALAGSDFVSKTQTLTFVAGGATTQNFVVAIVGDKVKEPTETFSVAISGVGGTAGAAIGTGVGTVTIIDNDGAMLAASTAPAGDDVAPLTDDALRPVVDLAIAEWKRMVPAADFADVVFTITDLPGDQLGWTEGRLVSIDATAAGWGWVVLDPTNAHLRMDLLTVLLHELGRTLGYTTDDAHRIRVMQPTLSAGEHVALRILGTPRPGRDTGLTGAPETVRRSPALPLVLHRPAALRIRLVSAAPIRDRHIVPQWNVLGRMFDQPAERTSRSIVTRW